MRSALARQDPPTTRRFEVGSSSSTEQALRSRGSIAAAGGSKDRYLTGNLASIFAVQCFTQGMTAPRGAV